MLAFLVGMANKSHELSKLKKDEGIFCTATVENTKALVVVMAWVTHLLGQPTVPQ
jgi:hypothetical protein